MKFKHLFSFLFTIALLILALVANNYFFQSESANFQPKELMFLEKNAYEESVWEELLAQDIIHFQDVDDAFHAYYDNDNHELSHQQHEAWEKIERAAKSQLDGAGNFYSKDKQYQDLLKYRHAKRNLNAPLAQSSFADPTTYTMGVPNAGNAGRWKNIGPFGNPEVQWSATGNGALDMVEFHPTNPAIMYVAARNRGLWRSNNYGNNWTPLTDHFATPHIRSIEVNKSHPDTIYLGGIGKIWRSTDSANSWTEVLNISSANVIQEIHSDPNNARRVIATTEGGVYRSFDAGQNWTEVFDGRFVQLDISEDWSLMLTADDNANVAPTLSYSLDKGDTWTTTTITNEYAEVDKFYFAITETNPKQVYAYGLVDGNTPTRFVGLWKSDFNAAPADGITHFTNFSRIQHPTYPYPLGMTQLVVDTDSIHGVKSETEDYYGSINPYSSARWISDFWVSPNNPDQLLTLREKMWGSETGGVSWEFKPSYGGSNWADNRYVTMNVAKDTIFWCNDGGIWCIAETDMFPTEAMVTASNLSKSAYMNSKVIPKNGDICVIEGSEMDVSQMNKDVIITGGQDLGQFFTRNGRDAHVASADIYRGRIKPNNDSLFHTGGLYVKINGSSDNYHVYNSINADYHNPDRMYGFTRKNTTENKDTIALVRSPAGTDAWQVNGFRGESRSNTGGGGWTPVNNEWATFTTSAGIAQINTGTFEQSRANAEIAFLGDENGNKLFITNNLSATQPTWTQLTNAPTASRYRIATHQFNENIVVAATDAGIYISKDKGQTWAARGTLPEGSPSRVLLDKNRTEGIYIMTSMTVYYLDETLTDWIEFNQGQPLHMNQDMRIAYYADGDNRLYVGKYGSGVWGSPLYSVLAANNDMPVVDFRIHGNSKNVINSGEKVQLIDLSMNYTTLAWTVENGAAVHNAGNEKYPTFTLVTPGFYKITLMATNDNGSILEVKERYIEVISQPDLVCVPERVGEMEWTRRIRYIDMNTERYINDAYDYYVPTDKIFEIEPGQSTLFLEQRVNYRTKYQRAWIDYNNDGDFDNTTEEIANSNGKVYNSTSNFTPPNTAILNTPLKMRVVVIDDTSAPTDCENVGDRQTVDLFVKIKTPVPTITNTHTVQTVNSATIASTYTNATDVLESGILYSTFNGNLNFNNATKVAKTGALTTAENFNTLLTDLEYNVTYYYQTYVLDASGLYYSEKKSFTLAPYKFPTAESFYAVNLGGTQWELKGFTYPEGNNLTSITLEHGATDFANAINLDISSLNVTNTLYINELVDIGAANSYQFRIKVVNNEKTFYSNIYPFDVNETYCTPSIDNNTWYKRWNKIEVGALSYTGNGNKYEDVSTFNFGALEMGSTHTFTMATVDGGWRNLSYIIYMDWNDDKDFDDYNEVVGSANASGLQTTDVTVTIPTENVITSKPLRMRIIGHEGGTVTSCSSAIGNYKDFTFSINAGDCTGTGHIVSYFADTDLDGFGDPNNAVLKNCSVTDLTGFVLDKSDCDDTNPNINPNAQEICDDGIDNNCDGYTDNANIVMGKTVTQSSTGSGGIASRATDGNTSGNWADGSVTHTNTEDNPYLDIDLAESHTLDSIILWNRTDCCEDRLTNFYVFLSDTPFSSTDPTVTAGQAGVWSQLTADNPGAKAIFQPIAAGQYLRIQLSGSGILSLAEVQTYTCVQTEVMSCIFYADTDGDGYGDPNTSLTQVDCINAPAGYVTNNSDFDDTERTAYTGAIEICDNIDNDGNGQIDDGADYDETTVLFDNEAIPTETYTASQTINTNQAVTVGVNADVHLIAGQSITLQTGFSVAAGAKFHAQIIDDCAAPFTNTEIAATTRTSSIATQSVGGQINMQITPNPFSSQTSINFYLSQAAKVSLLVYGMNGQVIEEVMDNKLYDKGQSSINFIAKTPMHGMYYFVLKTDTEVRTKKVIIIR